MRSLSAVLLALLLIGGCRQPTKHPSPVIVIDDAHNHLGNDAAQVFTIPAGPTLTLDATAYNFHIPSSLSGVTSPNAIQLVIDGTIYSAPWRSSRVPISLAPASFTPVKGIPRSSFSPGSSVIVAVGFQKPPEPDGTIPFWPFWASTIKVGAEPGA